MNEVDGYKIASIHCYYHHPEMNIFSVCGKLNQIKLNGKVFWANFFWLKIKNLAAVVVAQRSCCCSVNNLIIITIKILTLVIPNIFNSWKAKAEKKNPFNQIDWLKRRSKEDEEKRKEPKKEKKNFILIQFNIGYIYKVIFNVCWIQLKKGSNFFKWWLSNNKKNIVEGYLFFSMGEEGLKKPITYNWIVR